MKFIHIRNRAYDRICAGRTTRSASSNAWSASMAASAGGGVYADCGGNVVEMFKTLQGCKGRLLRCARLMMALWQGPKPFCRLWQDGRGSQTAKECQL